MALVINPYINPPKAPPILNILTINGGSQYIITEYISSPSAIATTRVKALSGRVYRVFESKSSRGDMTKILLAIALLSCLLFFGCSASSLPPASSTLQQNTVNCSQIIPSSMMLTLVDSGSNIFSLKEYYQIGNGINGWKIDDHDLRSAYCRKGNNQGENENYFYCGLQVSNTIKEVDKDGTILLNEKKFVDLNVVIEPMAAEHIGETPSVVISASCNLARVEPA